MEKTNPSLLSPANLAYLGDCVYELFVRERLVNEGTAHPSVDALGYVTAHVQAEAVNRILPLLTEEEEEIYRRGRNVSHINVPKSASQSEYRRATGLECLFGWLYLKGEHERLRSLFENVFENQ